MGRCRRCGCTEYYCDFWPVCANYFDALAKGFGKALDGNPQPNQNVAYRNCTCGHQRNNHY